MARSPRNEVVGVHHVYARGNNRGRIFLDDVDRHSYLAILNSVVARMSWRCLSYCLMHNHVHLLVETQSANLGDGMRRLHGLYARCFNDRHGRCGHLFQGRFGSVLQTADEQIWHVLAYIARNPVEAGLCSAPEEWRWSSHPQVLAGRAPQWIDERRLFQCFAGIGGDPRQRYAELVD